MSTRRVVANDDAGLWEVHESGCLLAQFESESWAREFAVAPELLSVLKHIVASAPIKGLPLALEKDIQHACAVIAKAEG